MKSQRPIFRVENLRIEREAVILHDVNWRVERGQHWVILGANGSGKTSLLSALTGYLVPSSGEIHLGSDRFGASDWREVRRSVGLVSSSLGHQIEPEQTVSEIVHSGYDAQINFWGQIPPVAGKRVLRLLQRVKVAHLADRPWRNLSQGERQRVLIGRAMMARPRLLFLDEPCAGLDPIAREDFLIFLSSLAKGRRPPTLVLVTHHVEEITPIFTHVLLLAKGRTLASGLIGKVLTSRLLGLTFGARVMIRRLDSRFGLTFGRHKRSFAL